MGVREKGEGGGSGKYRWLREVFCFFVFVFFLFSGKRYFFYRGRAFGKLFMPQKLQVRGSREIPHVAAYVVDVAKSC